MSTRVEQLEITANQTCMSGGHVYVEHYQASWVKLEQAELGWVRLGEAELG
jgi:hypothetical protein